MSDIQINNVIYNDDYKTNIIPFNESENINILIMNEINLKHHVEKIKQIISNMYSTNYTVYNICKQNDPFYCTNIEVCHKIANEWINLSNEDVKKIYIDKLIDTINRCANRTLIFCHIDIYEQINNFNEDYYLIVFENDYYGKFMIYNNKLLLYNGYDTFYLSSKLIMTINIGDELLIYDEKYAFNDHKNNKFLCISTFDNIKLQIDNSKKPVFNSDDDLNKIIKYINFLGINNIIDNTKFYLMNNINKIKKIASLNKKLYENLNKRLLGIINTNTYSSKNQNHSIMEMLKTFANKSYNYDKLGKNIRNNGNILKNILNIDKNIDRIKKYHDELTIQIFNNINLETNTYYNKSCDMYNYLISRSSWFDELQDDNIGGLLLCIRSPKLAKLGFNMSDIIIYNISDNLLTLEHICESQNIYLEEHLKYDDGRNTKNAIYGNILGNGNSILPLYLNKMHWQMVELQLDYSLGIMINQNPFDHYSKFYEIYPMVLLKYICQLTKSNINDKNITIFIQLLITTNKIFTDKYNHKINKNTISQCNELFENPVNRTESTFDNLHKLLGFTIYTDDINKIDDFNNIRMLKEAFLSELVRREYKKIYDRYNFYDLLNLEYLLKKITKMTDINMVMNEYIDNKEIYDYIIYNYVKCKIEDQIKNRYIDDDFLLNILDTESKTYRNFCKLVDYHIKYIDCWYNINIINCQTTINYLNEIITNEYGYISDECINYFKYKLQSIVNLQTINCRDTKKNFKLFMFLQTYFSIDNKHVQYNYKKNPYIRSDLLSLILHDGKMLRLIEKITSYPNHDIKNSVIKYISRTYDDNIIKRISHIINCNK